MTTKYVLNYKPAKLYINNYGSYIEYQVLHPQSNQLKRKRIWLNSIPYKRRKEYAQALIADLNIRLASGWNPFVNISTKTTNISLEKATDDFLLLKKKELKERTYKFYYNHIKIIKSFFHKKRITFINDFSKKEAIQMLNFVYLEKNWNEVSYNKFFGTCLTLWRFFIQYDFIKINPFKDFKKKKEKGKFRTFFSDEQLEIYFDFIKEDKWFTFYSYLTFYTFIRPNEISQLKFADIKINENIIIVPAEISKNSKRQIVTITNKMQLLIRELKFENFNQNMYVYSARHQPGYDYRSPHYIAKKFARIRKKIDFPKNLQFYSLKDTGIIKMLQAGVSPNIVRDQARHYSLEVTNRYVLLANEGSFTQVLNKVNY